MEILHFYCRCLKFVRCAMQQPISNCSHRRFSFNWNSTESNVMHHAARATRLHFRLLSRNINSSDGVRSSWKGRVRTIRLCVQFSTYSRVATVYQTSFKQVSSHCVLRCAHFDSKLCASRMNANQRILCDSALFLLLKRLRLWHTENKSQVALFAFNSKLSWTELESFC